MDVRNMCTLVEVAVTKYQRRVSCPLLDRIDIHIEVPGVDYEKLSEDRMGGRRNPFKPEYKLHAIFN